MLLSDDVVHLKRQGTLRRWQGGNNRIGLPGKRASESGAASPSFSGFPCLPTSDILGRFIDLLALD